MNTNKEHWKKINYALKYIRTGQSSHINCIRPSMACSDTHNRAVFERCLQYFKVGIPFMTEVILATGKRPDILLPLTMEIEEFLFSETDERFKEKDYRPFKVKAIRIK